MNYAVVERSGSSQNDSAVFSIDIPACSTSDSGCRRVLHAGFACVPDNRTSAEP